MQHIESDTIGIEGGDQLGKGELVRSIALELYLEGYDVRILTFPDYSTPIGYTIRTLLKEGFPEELEIDSSQQVILKMALFALNRLEILNCIMQDDFKGVYLMDRGPYSNALTIAHGVVNSKGLDIEELVDIALSFDRFIIDTMSLDRCVVQLNFEGQSWSSSRPEAGDLHERVDVQDVCRAVYEVMQERVGQNWRVITARTDNVWRERSQILRETMAFTHTRIQPQSSDNRSGSVGFFSVGDLSKHLYHGSNIDEKLQLDWEEAIRRNRKEDIYILGELIAKNIANNTNSINWANSEIKAAVRMILEEYQDIYIILEKAMGTDYTFKLLQSVYE